MEDENTVDIDVVPTTTDAGKEPETPKNPVQKELERVKSENPSRKEKLLYTKNRIEKQLAEEFPDAIISSSEEDDDKPLTRKDLQEFQRQQTVQTAFQLAGEIEDEHERELAKYHLEHTVRPSGNPKKDLENALTLVNAVKVKQTVEEIQRKVVPHVHSSGAGAPARHQSAEVELTSEELNFMRSFGLTKEQIVAARPK